MRRFGYLISACLLLTGTVEAAVAQDSQTSADLRCMSVMAKINQLPDQRHQLESLIGGYYYLGRIQALMPGLDLGPSIAAIYAKMSPSEFLSETTRCEQEMRTKGHAITEIGSAMPKPPASNGK